MNGLQFLLSQATSETVIDRLQNYTESGSQTVAQQQLSDPDYWGTVGIIALTGILVVFLILAILIFFFWLLGTIFKTVDKSKKKKAAAKAEAAKKEQITQAPVQDSAPKEAEDEVSADDEIAAVIAAAIAAYAEDEGTAYTIKSIKKHKSRVRSAWSIAGLNENMRGFN